MITDLNKILVEWAYQVKNGKPNHKSTRDLIVLDSVLKDFGWNLVERNELVNNLTEVDIVKNKDSGNIYTVQNVNKDKHTLIKKNASEDDIKKIEKDKEDKPEKKNITKDFASEIDKEYYSKEVIPSDEEYEKTKPPQLQLKEGAEPLKFSDEEIEFLSGNYPKKYVKVLERIMNTQKTSTFEPNIKSFTDAAGAGQISSTAGEILSMMTISMTDEQMGLLEQKLGEHFDNIDDSMFKKGSKKSKLIIDRDWFESSKGARITTHSRYDDMYGKGNWKVTASSWDTKNDVRAMGFDYSKKGFSTDAFFRLDVNGEQLLDEVSFKKDLEITLAQPSVSTALKWTLTDEEKAEYDDMVKQLEQKDENGKDLIRGKKRTELNAKKKELLNKNIDMLGEGNPKLASKKELDNAINILDNITDEQLTKLQNLSDDEIEKSKVDAKGKIYLKKMSELLKNIEPPMSREKLQQIEKTKAVKNTKKAASLFSKALGNNGDDAMKKAYQDHIGIVKKMGDQFIKNLIDVPELYDGVMSDVRKKFPLKSLLEGEERMCFGGVTADEIVSKEIFGTDNYDEIEQKLKVLPPDPSKKGDTKYEKFRLGYQAEAGGKEVIVADMYVRQRGLGYSESPNFSMEIADDFKEEIVKTNQKLGREIYDPYVGAKSFIKKYGNE